MIFAGGTVSNPGLNRDGTADSVMTSALIISEQMLALRKPF